MLHDIAQIRATSCCLLFPIFIVRSYLFLLSRSAHAHSSIPPPRLHLTVWRPPYAGTGIYRLLQASLSAGSHLFLLSRSAHAHSSIPPPRLHLTVWRPPYAGTGIYRLLQASLHSGRHQFRCMSRLVSHLVQIVFDFPVGYLHAVCFVLFFLRFYDLMRQVLSEYLPVSAHLFPVLLSPLFIDLGSSCTPSSARRSGDIFWMFSSIQSGGMI